MDILFGLAMVLGIGPALALMYVVVRKYTFPRVEQPFFSDPTFFGLFMVGLVIGSVEFFAMSMLRLSSNMILMVLLSVIQMMAFLLVMNLRRFRGKSDSVFYGYGLGLGTSSGLATGVCFTTTSVISQSSTFDASVLVLVVISVSLTMILGACGTNVGEGIARNRPTEYLLQGLLPLVAYNMVLTVLFSDASAVGDIVYYASAAVVMLLSAAYFYYSMYVRLPGVVRDVLRMEGKRRDDIPR